MAEHPRQTHVASGWAWASLLAMMVAACSPAAGPGAGSSQQTAQPAAKQTLVMTAIGEPTDLGGLVGAARGGAGPIKNVLNDTLVVRDDNNVRRSLLALELPTV